MAAELIKRAGEYLPGAEPDWKMKGPGRVFFQRPDSFVASILWDFYLAVSVFSGSFLQYGDDKMALVHTLYDEICVKEYWYTLLDAAQARRPRQLATWDGRAAHDVGCGVASGGCNLVAKISDSYLGIGDKILKRGKAAGGDFDDLDDVQRLLEADPQYAGKQAVLCEFVSPSKAVTVSSEGFSNVHSLDIVTTRTKSGVKVSAAASTHARAAHPHARPLDARATHATTHATHATTHTTHATTHATHAAASPPVCAPSRCSPSSCGRTAPTGRRTRARPATSSTCTRRRSSPLPPGTAPTSPSRTRSCSACGCPASARPAPRPSPRTRRASCRGSPPLGGTP